MQPGSALPLPAAEGWFLRHLLLALTSPVGPAEVLSVRAIGPSDKCPKRAGLAQRGSM